MFATFVVDDGSLRRTCGAFSDTQEDTDFKEVSFRAYEEVAGPARKMIDLCDA